MLSMSMELSRERKIFIGVFGTAIVAFGIDRGVLGASEASAAAPIDLGAVATAASSESGDPVQTGGVGQTISLFAERLQTLGNRSVDPMSGGDAFSVPAAWLAVEAAPDEAPAPQATVGPPTHRVTSVMPTQDGGIAIIDGRTYRQGEAIGSFVLETVEPRSVVLRRGDSLYRVGLAD